MPSCRSPAAILPPTIANHLQLSVPPVPDSTAFNMWDDQPINRPDPPAEMPPPTRAFLSQFNRSFTPPALINDPYVVDRKLTVTPFLFGSRPAFKPRNPFAVDPAVERAHHYMRPKQKDAELCPSPRSAPIPDDEEWSSDEDKYHAMDDFVNQLSPLSDLQDGKPANMIANSHKKTYAEPSNGKGLSPAFSFRILEPGSSDNAKPGEREDGRDRVIFDVEHVFDGNEMMELSLGGHQMMTGGRKWSSPQSDRTSGASWDEWE
jgi:hypothetical protein